MSACADITLRHHPDRHATARLAGARAADLCAIYAFDAELARIPFVISEPMLGEIRLQWWRDAIAEIYAGAAPRRHEVVTPLAEVIARHALPRDLFDAVIEARGFDFRGEPHASIAAFHRYAGDRGGGIMRLAAAVVDGSTAGDRAAACLGQSMAVAEVLEDAPRAYAAKHSPIPGVTPDRNAIAEGRTPNDLRDAINALAAQALDQRAQAPKAPAALPALMAGWRSLGVLRRASRADLDLFRDLTPRSEFIRRGALAWRVLIGAP